MKIPFDDLNMRDQEHVDWVKSTRDPELWHAAAIAIVNTLGDSRGFLIWLAEQPEMDRATAGYVFLAYGSSYLRGQTDFSGGEGMSGEEWLNALKTICRRAATTGFTNDSLGLPSRAEAARQAWLDLINRGEVANGAIPHALVDTPFPPEKKLRYFVEDGSVLDYGAVLERRLQSHQRAKPRVVSRPWQLACRCHALLSTVSAARCPNSIS